MQVPRIRVGLSGYQPKDCETDCIYAIAGVDTYTTQSIISQDLVSRLRGVQISPSGGREGITFVDGSEISVIGSVLLCVAYQSVTTAVKFLVVHTVSENLGAELLLGTDYMAKRCKRLILEFTPASGSFVSAAMARSLCEPEKIDGKDFILHRRQDGCWELSWQWAHEPPEDLFKGTYMYTGKLKSEKHKALFNTEIKKWLDEIFLIPYSNELYGNRRCVLTWNPVVQVHKSTPIRPTLDYSILNAYIKNTNFVSQSEVCHESLRKWRRYTCATLVDIEKAYMNVWVSSPLWRFQAVKHDGRFYAMTRMGFGLNIAPRVLKCLIEYILKLSGVEDVINPYRDDILVCTDDSSAIGKQKHAANVAALQKLLLFHGLPTKKPVNLFDFRSGPTRALGLELYDQDGTICWRRRSDSNWKLPEKDKANCRDISGFVGRSCPASYPILGYLRPMALHILSLVGKQAHEESWNSVVSDEILKKCKDLESSISSSDPVTGQWKIPQSTTWIMATDASTQALGCVAMGANRDVLEDHCWLVKQRETHINVLELDGVIKGFKVLNGYAKQGDSVQILVDNTSVSSWLAQVLNDEKISVTGLYELLVRRRLGIVRELFNDYSISVKWVASDQNPADELTRVPTHWFPATKNLVCAALIPDSDQLMERIRVAQIEDSKCVEAIERFDQNSQLVVRNGCAYRRCNRGKTEILQLIVPEAVLHDIIGRCHIEIGHWGWKPTWYDVKSKYYSVQPNLAESVRNFVKNLCRTCFFKNSRNVQGANEHTLRTRPFDEVFIDTLQIFSLCETPPHSALTIIDNFTKFVEVLPIWSKSGQEITGKLEPVLARYGTVRKIRCDNGREFKNETIELLCAKYGIEIAWGAVRNPQGQSPVERFHSTLLAIIRSQLFGTDDHWTSVLERSLHAYRERPHRSLNNRTPREALLGYPSAQVPDDFDPDVFQAEIFDEIDVLEDQFTFNQSATLPRFSPGDRVLVSIDKRRSSKTRYPWVNGTVVRYLGRGSYLIQDERGRLASYNEKLLATTTVPIPLLPPVVTPQSHTVRTESRNVAIAEPNPELDAQDGPEEELRIVSPMTADHSKPDQAARSSSSAPVISQASSANPSANGPAQVSNEGSSRKSKRSGKKVVRLIENI